MPPSFLVLLFFENLRHPVEDAVELGDCHAVVGDGDVYFLCFDYAGHELFAREHAAAAMEDQRVVAEVFREVGAGADVDG